MGPCFGTILRRVKKNRGTKIICLVHNLIPHEKRIGDRPFTQYFVKPVDGFVVQSKSVLDDLASFNITERVSLIPHPIYDNFGDKVGRQAALKHLKLDEGENYMMFFGFIRDYKGLDILLRAMALPKVKQLGLKLIIAGEFYSDEQHYMDLIEELGIKEDLILRTQFISNEDVRYYFAVADLIVQPYKTATQSGISQMAYHFEKPMIVTNVGGLPEIVLDNKAGYVTEVSPEAIAEAIDKFYSMNKAEAFTNFIRIKKKEYSWQNMMNAMIDLSYLSA
jgi:glycosyltransferase involved in cell wall biosynthesis